MTPRLADLICLADGSWEICRTYACEQNSGDEDERTLLRLPLELCADGTWTLSGLDDRKFREVFGEFEKPIPDVIPEYINAQLHRLSGMRILNEHSWPNDAYPVRISGRGCRVLDEIRFSITDLIHALSEPDRGLLERIDESSPTSIFGLLRDAGESDLAHRFLKGCPETLLPLAEIPLVSLDQASDNEDSRFSFLHAIGNIDWTGESELGRAAEQLQVRIARNGVARISVTEWMFFGRRFRSIEPRHHWLHLGDIRVLDELLDVPETVERLIRRLFDAGRKNLVRQGMDDDLREKLIAPVTSIVQDQLDSRLQRLILLAKERIFPFDGISRPATYADYFAGRIDPQIRARRLQARLVTPLLAECIATGKFPGAAKAVDEAQPAIQSMASELGVPIWVVSRLAKLAEFAPNRQSEFGPRRDPSDLAKVARVMTALGPNTPALKPELHTDAHAIWDNAEQICSAMDDAHSIFGRDFFGHAKEDTRMMIRAIGREHASHINGNPETGETCDGRALFRMANEAASISLYYCIARESIRHHLQYDHDDRADVERTLASWFLRQSATELLEAANKVASVMQMYCDGIMSPMLLTALTERTQSLLDAHACGETGVEIIPLSTKAALEEEGELMHHCVGGYWGRAANHQVELFSLQLRNSGIRATLCLARDPDDVWHVEEFKHARNEEVTDERLLQAAEALCGRLEAAIHGQGFAEAQNISFVQYDRHCFALQLLPSIARESLLPCFPGSGWLEARIEHAIAVAERIRRRNRRRT